MGWSDALWQLEDLAEGKRKSFTRQAEGYICATIDITSLLRHLSGLWLGENIELEQRKRSSVRCAHLLREIVGNPFRPSVVLPRDLGTVLRHGAKTYRQQDVILADWLTSTVLSLAHAAYDERPGQWERTPLRGVTTQRHVEDGHLDPARLAILADALEEAGCEGERRYLCANIGKHRHGGRSGQVIHGVLHESDPRQSHHHHDAKCPILDEPHPLVAHLRHPGPHVRGCWALDTLLGKD